MHQGAIDEPTRPPAGRLAVHHEPFDAPESITGRQRYARTLGGAFVQQHWTYDHPEFPDAIGLLSEDRYYYFDVRGIVRIFELELGSGGWTMTHLDEDSSQRYVVRFRDDPGIDVAGKKSHDGGINWQHDFTMFILRVD